MPTKNRTFRRTPHALSFLPFRIFLLVASSLLVGLALLTLPAPLVAQGSGDQSRKLENAGESQQASGRKVALIIGNTNYARHKLKNPSNDARAMHLFLLKSAGFEVVEKNDLNEEQMEQAVAEFGRAIKGASVALFYYSGHGVQAKGVNFLVPIVHNIRSEEDIPVQALPLHRVFEQFKTAKSTLNLVFLDACRNDPFERGLKDFGNRGLAEVSAPEGTLIASIAPMLRLLKEFRYAEVETEAHKVLSTDPGNIYYSQKKYDKAIEEYDRALLLAPDDQVIIANRAGAVKAKNGKK